MDFTGDVRIRWYEDGVLNASANCIDRHIGSPHPALIYEGNHAACGTVFTFDALHEHVCRLANALKALNVRRGDRVLIYLPMIPEAVLAMLACARIGAVHAVIFTGLGSEALAERIVHADARVVVAADAGLRGPQLVPLKARLDAALERLDSPPRVLMFRHSGTQVDLRKGRDFVANDLMDEVSRDCPPEPMSSEDPLFILYTSGPSDRPKGLVHATGGYLAHAAGSHATVFEPRSGDRFWCTADLGWITGHTYTVYGPLANGTTTLLFGGHATYPDPGRCWQIVDKHAVTHFYTTPTNIRELRRFGDGPVERSSRRSLRVLGTVGEPIDKASWRWLHDVVGDKRCGFVDTWWQTETGAAMISPVASMPPEKPGSSRQPLPGTRAGIVTAEGLTESFPAEGELVLLSGWPGQARTMHRDHDTFIRTYFLKYPGMFATGDLARRDEDGDYWILGRADDVLNVSSLRVSTAEVERALVAHPSVVEAAAIGIPHDVRGETVFAFLVPIRGVQPNTALAEELRRWVRARVGPTAIPDRLRWVSTIPRTESGQPLKTILRSMAADDASHPDYPTLGDTDLF